MRCFPRFVFALVASHSNSIVISAAYSPEPKIQLIVSILRINPTQFPTAPPAPRRDANYRPPAAGCDRPHADNAVVNLQMDTCLPSAIARYRPSGDAVIAPTACSIRWLKRSCVLSQISTTWSQPIMEREHQGTQYSTARALPCAAFLRNLAAHAGKESAVGREAART
jgi:hypothetical protein